MGLQGFALHAGEKGFRHFLQANRFRATVVYCAAFADYLNLRHSFWEHRQLSLETFVASQQGSFNHRHLGMPARIKNAKKIGRLVPPKRYEKEKITVDFKWVQKQRMKVRSKSLQIWQQDKDAKVFDKKMKKSLKKTQVSNSNLSSPPPF